MIKKFNVEKTKQLKKINTLLSLFYKKPQAKRKSTPNKIRSILIIDFALMGDMIMDIPFLRTIKHNCPKATITMVCMPWAETILGSQGLIDRFIVFDGKNKLISPKSIIKNWREIRHIMKEINKCSYDLGIEPKGDLRHIMFLHYTHCERTVSYNYTGGDFLITDSFEPLPKTQHLVDEKLDLLKLIGFTIFEEDRIPKLMVGDTNQRYPEKMKESFVDSRDKLIGLHPGASNTNKQYEYYPELIIKINEQLQGALKFLVFEGPNEKAIVDTVIDAANANNVKYERVKKPLKEYISLISCCDYMVCNDSAAGHFAAAYGIPTLVIFGAVYPEVACPRGSNTVVCISHELPCKPCTLPECPIGTYECIRSISTKEVLDGFGRLIDLN